MTKTNTRSFRYAGLATLFLAAAVFAEPAVNGRIESIGSIPTLRVWGSYDEMGYAHGYLLADKIVGGLDDVLFTFFREKPEQYGPIRDALLKHIDTPANARKEIHAIYNGIVAVKGQTPKLEQLGRPLEAADLFYFNALDTIRAFGCSGFTVWGDAAGGKGVITTRNFDFAPFTKRVVQNQMIIVRQPTGKHPVASIAWPGYVGAYTGINSTGVAAFMHDGNAPRVRKPQGRYTPIALRLAEMLEVVTPRTAHTKTGQSLSKTNTAFSYMVRLVLPKLPDIDEVPLTVYRIDPYGLTATPFENDRCITTNHYVGDTRHKSYPDTERRYKTLEDALKNPVTSTSAWASLDAVSANSIGLLTLHALVYYPNEERLELAVATWTDHTTPATRNPRTNVTFKELFAKK